MGVEARLHLVLVGGGRRRLAGLPFRPWRTFGRSFRALRTRCSLSVFFLFLLSYAVVVLPPSAGFLLVCAPNP